MKLQGADELLKAMRQVEPKLRKKHLRRAVTQGAAQVRNEVRRRAPVNTGRLKRNIISKGRRGKRTYVKSSVFVRTAEREQEHDISTGQFMATTGKKESRSDPKDAYYWIFIERGTKHRPATPFIRPAVAAKFKPVVNHVINETNKGIRSEIRKAGVK
jgi:HK97 gp10 family phage protein